LFKKRFQQSKITSSDFVVWIDRANEVAFLAVELKTHTTPFNDPVFFAAVREIEAENTSKETSHNRVKLADPSGKLTLSKGSTLSTLRPRPTGKLLSR
jgi:hypothetical protein